MKITETSAIKAKRHHAYQAPAVNSKLIGSSQSLPMKAGHTIIRIEQSENKNTNEKIEKRLRLGGCFPCRHAGTYHSRTNTI